MVEHQICLIIRLQTLFLENWGWSGGAMVLGKLPVPGCPTNFAYSRTRAYSAYSRCGWGLFGHFCSRLSSFLSPSLWETARYRLNYCLKGPLSPKQPTNQPNLGELFDFDLKRKAFLIQFQN